MLFQKRGFTGKNSFSFFNRNKLRQNRSKGSGTVISVEISRKTQFNEKNNLEILFSQILQILGFTNREQENFNIEIRECTSKEEQNSFELLIKLSVNNPKPKELKRFKKKERDYEFIRKLNHVLKKNFSNPDFNVKQLAGMLHMSQATMYRWVKKVTGTSPVDYLRSFRLDQAVLLLKSNSGTIFDLAIQTGFNSRCYFTKCFKKKILQYTIPVP